MKPTFVDDNWICALYVASRALQQQEYLNKTRFQKLVYFAQEVGGLPSSYRFAIDYYGPFSRDLAAHLSLSNVLEYTQIDEADRRDHSIELTSATQELLTENQPDVDAFAPQVDEVIDCLSGRSAPELGLLATIHFVARRVDSQDRREEIVNTVARLKPQASRDEILRAYEELERLDWLT